MDTCSPVDSRRSISRAGGFSLSAAASPTSSSVVLPMADTTATTRLPACLRAMRRLATIWMRSGEATDVPPNLHTIKGMAFSLVANEPSEPSLYQTTCGFADRSPLSGAFFTAKMDWKPPVNFPSYNQPEADQSRQSAVLWHR